MHRITFESTSIALTFVIVFVSIFVVGLHLQAASSQSLPQNPKVRGYHTQLKTPSGIFTEDDQTNQQILEAELLEATLKELRGGHLEAASQTLQKLVVVAPGEPSYAQLLAMSRRQLESEGWIRFQSKYVANDNQEVDSKGISSATALEDMLVLRLRLTTWMAPLSCPPKVAPR